MEHHTRALLVTDVVDSTKLAEELGDAAMSALWAKHDRAARDLLRLHRGREIDKTDGFLMLFDDATDAVAYALAYHRAVRQLGIAVRTGIHVGPVILTENAAEDVARGAKPLEVDGIAKPTAARVMSVASGGQTLLTRVAADALGPTSLRVQSHGRWRMKGVSEPVELLEVGDEGAPWSPPPDGAKVYRVVERDGVWLPAREVRHQLPAERDAFVGRAADLRALAELLEQSRLVSVLGIGGTGKTRLVTRYAWTWLGDFPGGAWFCDLSEARSAEGIAYAVASALDVPLGKEDPVVTLGHAIAGRGECLIVLDNFEQVARYASETLGRWLDRAREARFVVTTREVLGLPGEGALSLSPLADADSMALFVARARQSKRDFVADDEAAIRSLVALLDHLPLAIELAAARVRVMPPKALLQRMGERFKLLSSSGARHTRQATLHATFDWSWDLLSGDERSALAQLSVFEGGFTLEAAEGVLALPELWPVDAVQALVDRSWVRPVSADRFDMLLSVQEYAVEKLAAVGDRAEVEARHGAWFAQFGEDEAIAALDRHGGVERLWALRRDLDNVAVACRRAVARRDVEVAERTFAAGAQVMLLAGSGAPLADLSSALLGLDLPKRARGRLSWWRGWALQSMSRLDDARACFDEALELAREVGDRVGEGVALCYVGGLSNFRGRSVDALVVQEQAVAIARELGDRPLEGMALGNLGVTHILGARTPEARDSYERALAIYREVGNRRAEGYILGNLGGVYSEERRLAEARAHFEQALAIHAEVGNRRYAGEVLTNFGALHHKEGRLDEASATYERALAIHRELGNRRSEAVVLGNIGLLRVIGGRVDEGRACFQQAMTIQREVGNRPMQATMFTFLGLLARDVGRDDEARAAFEGALGLHRELGDRRAEAVALGNLGDCLSREGRAADARTRFEEALALYRELRLVPETAHPLRALARIEASNDGGAWLPLADEAVAVSAVRPESHAESLVSRARLRLDHGDVVGARADVVAARSLGRTGDAGATVALADARTSHAEARPTEALEALNEALALAGTRRPPDLVREFEEVRALLGARA